MPADQSPADLSPAWADSLSASLPERLSAAIPPLGPCAVGFSGGVDSALLAAALLRFRSPDIPPPIALTAESATTSDDERCNAQRVAAEIGIRLLTLETDEMRDPQFLANGPERCYYCKRIRFAAMRDALLSLEKSEKIRYTLCDGSNADDANDYRPGRRALAELGVRSPLAEAGLTKAEIRALAAEWGLSCAERPSNPCLVTRFPYGMTPTDEALRRVEAAERWLKMAGFPICRVRLLLPLEARIEVPREETPKLLAPPLAEQLTANLTALGFQHIHVDPEGFVSGKMNRTLRLPE